MASSSGQPIRLAIQIILAIAIIGLAYWLYLSITEPYKVIEREQQLTRITRDRMSDIRSAMIRYNEQNGRYLTTLDSLVEFIRQDSVLRVASDSVFGEGLRLDRARHHARERRKLGVILFLTREAGVRFTVLFPAGFEIFGHGITSQGRH